MSDQFGGSGFPFICNLLARVEATGWVIGKYSNQDWGGRFKNDYSMKKIAWGASIDPRPAYLPWSPVKPRATRRCVRDDFCRRSRQECLWCQYNWRNNLVNTWVHCRDDDRDGPVTQYFLFRIPVASVSNCSVPFASVINCLRIACKITLCITGSLCV